MIRKPIFDAIRRLLGRGLRQREVAQLDAAITCALGSEPPAPPAAPVGTRMIGSQGTALIKRFEGCARRIPGGLCEAYPDPASPLARTGSGSGAPWTIGWGATGPGIGPGTVWSQAECDARLERDLVRFAAEVARAIGDVPTTQAQFDALVSFHYNTGAIARATLTAKHKHGDHAGAAAEFARWNRAGGRVMAGLVRRRAAEAALYRAGAVAAGRQEPAHRAAVGPDTGDRPMSRLLCAAAVAVFAVSNPVLAQGKSSDHRGHVGADVGGGVDHAATGHAPVDGQNSGRDRSEGRAKANSDAARDVRGTDKADARRAARGADTARPAERVVTANDRSAPWNRDNEGSGNRRNATSAPVPACPPGLAKKNTGCLPPGFARGEPARYAGYAYRPALFGIPLRAGADYVYYDGYLIPAAANAGLPYIPLLGGALAVGQAWPKDYPSPPIAEWQRDYYGLTDPEGYRYADNVVYRVDPDSQAIEAIVALLTGNQFAVGQPMPTGYDVYNVPGPYRDRYHDTDAALYRYADGRVYEIDPTSKLIAQAIDLIA